MWPAPRRAVLVRKQVASAFAGTCLGQWLRALAGSESLSADNVYLSDQRVVTKPCDRFVS
jgi:hypothetical protein